MKQHSEMRGGFPVAAFDTLPEAERVLVRALRHWSDGPDGQERIARLLLASMGEAEEQTCQRALNDVMGVIARHGRRKLVRHKETCSCVGADEAVFAHFVMLAATGEREDAMLIGSLIVEGPLLMAMTEAARQAGLYLHRATISKLNATVRQRAGATLH